MRSFFYIVFLLIAFVNLSAQQDTSLKLLKDQNPNYLKSKKKYEITYVDTVSIKKAPLKDSSPIVSNKPVIVAPVISVSELDTYLNKLAIALKNKDLNTIIECYDNIGDYYNKSGNLSQAQSNYEKALASSNSLNSKSLIVKNLYNIGSVLYKKKDYSNSESYYQKAIGIAKASKYDEYVKLLSNELSKLYVKQGNYKNAYEMHLLFQQTTDSLYRLETQRNIEQHAIKIAYTKKHLTDSLVLSNTKLNYQSNIEKKEQEIENKRLLIYIVLTTLLFISAATYLFYRNYKIAKQAKDLISEQKQQVEDKKVIIEKSLEEKEILLKEIHHRVKNNLQIISSLLNMQSNRLEDEALKKVMVEAKNRISSMSLIHQNIYQSGNLSTIDFADYTNQLVKSIEKTISTQNVKVEYIINSNGLTMNMDTAIPIGLIINELITNSFKYAFLNKENGIISIELKQLADGQLELHYSDNGAGIPDNIDINASKPLGLKLVKGLIGQLKGVLKIENNNGAHFNIVFTAKE